jgi:phospholipid/cholesterol/gamma-HCH transport system permease protein
MERSADFGAESRELRAAWKDVRPVTDLVKHFVEWFGELGFFCGEMVRALFTTRFEFAEFAHQLDELGAKSLPLAILAGGATGVVLALETHQSLARFGARSLLPALLMISIIKESGPIITGLVVSGRAAAGIGAELAAMRVTEQIDAMEASAVNPYGYLALTRVLACIVMLPLLTLVADFCGVFCGWVASTLMQSVSLQLFLVDACKSADFTDFVPPTAKTAFFGLIMGVVACYQGMRAKGGTEGVERAATSSVVISSLCIILADVVLVKLIQVIWP